MKFKNIKKIGSDEYGILFNYPVYYLPAKELLTKTRHLSKLKTGGVLSSVTRISKES